MLNNPWWKYMDRAMIVAMILILGSCTARSIVCDWTECKPAVVIKTQ